MHIVLMALGIIFGLVQLGCYIWVLVRMFQEGQSTLGIVCIVLTLCFGIGALIAFIYGWINVQKWNLMPVMAAWTGCFVINLILNLASMALSH